MADEHQSPPVVHLTLNPRSVATPIVRSVQDSLEVVSIAIDAVAKADLTQPLPKHSKRFTLTFGGDNRSVDQKRNSYSAWLLARGLQELARGVRQSLEKAVGYIEMAERVTNGTFPLTLGELETIMAPIRKRAGGLSFPDLMATVNSGLSGPLHFEQQFVSLQKARNCLEHRNGVVTKIDADSKTGLLSLSFPRPKIYWIRKGEEIEIEADGVIEGEDGRGASINMRMVTERRDFKLGQRVSITAEEFNDIGWGCWAFSQELVRNLPKGATPGATATAVEKPAHS